MSTSSSQSWGDGQTGFLTFLLVVFFIWIFAGGRPLFGNTGRDIKTTLQVAGKDFKSKNIVQQLP